MRAGYRPQRADVELNTGVNFHTSREEVRGNISDLDGGSRPKRDNLRSVRTDFRL